MKFSNTTHKGFTLVETLVAITILLLAIVGPMTIATQSIKTATFSRQQLVAVFLAQEALESLIKLRNDDVLDGGATWDWYDNPTVLDADCKTANGCGYSTHDQSYRSCATLSNCQLLFDPDANNGILYSYDTSPANEVLSSYTRTIRLTTLSPDEVGVVVDVTWSSGAFTVAQTHTLESSILNKYKP